MFTRGFIGFVQVQADLSLVSTPGHLVTGSARAHKPAFSDHGLCAAVTALQGLGPEAVVFCTRTC